MYIKVILPNILPFLCFQCFSRQLWQDQKQNGQTYLESFDSFDFGHKTSHLQTAVFTSSMFKPFRKSETYHKSLDSQKTESVIFVVTFPSKKRESCNGGLGEFQPRHPTEVNDSNKNKSSQLVFYVPLSDFSIFFKTRHDELIHEEITLHNHELIQT